MCRPEHFAVTIFNPVTVDIKVLTSVDWWVKWCIDWRWVRAVDGVSEGARWAIGRVGRVRRVEGWGRGRVAGEGEGGPGEGQRWSGAGQSGVGWDGGVGGGRGVKVRVSVWVSGGIQGERAVARLRRAGL